MQSLYKLITLLKKCCFTSSEISKSDLEKDNQTTETKENPLSTSFQKAYPLSLETLKLTLKVQETVFMDPGIEYEILPSGLKNSKRNIKDGCVYAGSIEKFGRLVINDIVLPFNEKGTGKRQFMIQYNKEQNKYFIKDMGEGLGTFIRIEIPIKLHTSYTFVYGDTHMIVYIENTILKLKFIQGPKADSIYIFTPNESPIKIGRMSDCNIKIEDSGLSRYHCLAYYDNCWMFTDGDGQKNSTNGTWLFAEKFFEINNGMMIRTGETVFKAQFTSDMLNIIE
ncbi:hypothetical protein SteCoe_19747 [Stentor coeruleus]|uniref:FHA domain-containing protein n=1 Tax=Stentor coeruleus TaxID=5963 RepID=A0A1R2BTF2_9CILI|nr:hypothetical protein SteCoe_19747 [Stentor coeruleus]